jgi:hypothetical protein
MVGKKRAPKRGKRTAIGDRVTFIGMMDKDVVADIKQAAVDEHRAAWDVMERPPEWLKRSRGAAQIAPRPELAKGDLTGPCQPREFDPTKQDRACSISASVAPWLRAHASAATSENFAT